MDNETDITQRCRLCLLKEQVDVPIFDDEDVGRQILSKISVCLPIKVQRDDKLPKKICSNCSFKLDVAHELRLTSAASDKQLRQWLREDVADDMLSVPEKNGSTLRLTASSLLGASTATTTDDLINLKQEVIEMVQEDELHDGIVDANEVSHEYLQEHFSQFQDSYEGENSLSTVEPTRKRRRAATLASTRLSSAQLESDDDEDSLSVAKITKTEEQSDDDDNDDDDPEPTAFVGLPSTSVDEPGPSGLGKGGSSEVPCHDAKDFCDPIQLFEEDGSDEAIYPDCATCLKLTDDPKKLKSHKRTHKERRYPCRLCDKSYSYQYLLEGHMKTAHRHEKKRTFCPYCHTHLSSVEALELHLQRHTMSPQHQCDKCDKGYYSKQTLDRHMKVYHDGFRFKCSQCDKTYLNKSSYNTHILTHDPTYVREKIACPKCDVVLGSASSYRKHMKIHEGKNKRICELCGKQIGSAASLRDHMNLHLGDKKYACEVCGKAFVKKQNLDLHMRTHTKEKPYMCTVCGQSFSQRSSWKIHSRYHTGEKPYPCTLCERAFITRGQLTAHLLTH